MQPHVIIVTVFRPLRTDRERKSILTVLDYLEKSAAQYPDKTALIDDTGSMTFSDLKDAASRIASGLIRRTGLVNEPVVVLVDRCIAGIAAFLGVAMSHNFYVPVDAGQPAGRLQAIVGVVQPAAVISLADASAELQETVKVPVYEYRTLIGEAPDEALLKEARGTILDTDPLYAVCTSGTTGVPKAVIKSHRSVTAFIPVFAETFGFRENDVFGNQSPFDFDVSAKDIYSCLYLGASLFVIPRVCFAMPKLLVEALDDRHVTTLIWSVSALCVAAGINAFKHRVPAHIRQVLFSGEVMPIKMLNIWRSYYPDARFVNLYGPTEVTGNSLYYVVDRPFELHEQLPLGRPFPNSRVLFLDENGREIGPGGQGEICLLGTSLALGYYRNPEKTAASFVQNPLNDRYPERMYRTGDLAELRDDGNYYFAARKDFQIKHMGHRIELEELETFLNAADGVTRAACLFDRDRGKIVACYTGDADKVDIIASLKKDLPKYMIPNIYIRLDRMPLTNSGKTDRRAIQVLYEESFKK